MREQELNIKSSLNAAASSWEAEQKTRLISRNDQIHQSCLNTFRNFCRYRTLQGSGLVWSGSGPLWWVRFYLLSDSDLLTWLSPVLNQLLNQSPELLQLCSDSFKLLVLQVLRLLVLRVLVLRLLVTELLVPKPLVLVVKLLVLKLLVLVWVYLGSGREKH